MNALARSGKMRTLWLSSILSDPINDSTIWLSISFLDCTYDSLLLHSIFSFQRRQTDTYRDFRLVVNKPCGKAEILFELRIIIMFTNILLPVKPVAVTQWTTHWLTTWDQWLYARTLILSIDWDGWPKMWKQLLRGDTAGGIEDIFDWLCINDCKWKWRKSRWKWIKHHWYRLLLGMHVARYMHMLAHHTEIE